RRRLKVHGIIVLIILFSLIMSPFNPLTQNRFSGIAYQQGFQLVTPHDRILDSALSFVPANASILTQNDLFSHVSNRADAYLYLWDNRTTFQYVLADAKSSAYTLAIYGTQSMAELLPYFLSSGRYGIVANDDGVIF